MPSTTPIILVTGANGQLGQELQALAAQYPQYSFHFVTRQEMPLDDSDAITDTFKQLQPQYCLNCAAYTAVDKAETEQEQAFRVNGQAVGEIAVLCRQYGARLFHISTDYVFNGTGSVPYVETDPTDPVNMYGASKLQGEELAQAANPNTIIIRTSWVYSQYGKNFVRTMRQLMQQRDELKVVDDQWGSPTWAGGLAANLLQLVNLLEAGQPVEPGIYHYSDAGTINWHQFAVAIQELTGSHCRVLPIPTSGYPTPAKRPAWSVMNTEKIQQLPGVVVQPWKEHLEICLGQLD